MVSGTRTRLVLVCLLVVLVAGTGIVSSTPQPAMSDADVTSTTTTNSETCSGDVQEKASISQSSIQAVDDQITTDQPALVSGQIVAPQSNQCTVVVQMVLTIPSDMYVSGTDDVGSSGQGKLSATFRLSPGETQSMSAQVYASSTGTRVIIADFLYYPVGHPEDERQLTGFSMEIEAIESNLPGGNSTKTNNSNIINGSTIVGLVGLLIIVVGFRFLK